MARARRKVIASRMLVLTLERAHRSYSAPLRSWGLNEVPEHMPCGLRRQTKLLQCICPVVVRLHIVWIQRHRSIQIRQGLTDLAHILNIYRPVIKNTRQASVYDYGSFEKGSLRSYAPCKDRLSARQAAQGVEVIRVIIQDFFI